jgi:hypothetical protein
MGRALRDAPPCQLAALLFDVLDDEVGEPGTAQGVDLADAGGTGDVDLGEVVADHIDVGKHDAQPGELGPQSVADLLVTCADAACIG